MICPKCAHTMTDDLAYCECCGTYLTAPQPKVRVVSTSTYRFDLYDQPQGYTAVASAGPSAQATTAFYNVCEPVGQPVASAPVPRVPKRTGRRSRKLRTILSASIVSMLLLGFGGGMTAFAHEDADSRMPLVVEYEETVDSAATATELEADAADVVTILDDETPMASAPTSAPDAEAFAVDVETAPVTDAAPAPIAGALEQTPAAPAPDPLAPYTLEINGTRVPYIHSVFAALCPDRNAALWAGSDDTTDGSYGYFIGHNPGDFACVYALVPGNYVTLCDANGNLRNYTVTKLYDVPNTTVFQEVLQQIIPSGESLVMQTCIGDGSYYRIVVCQ